MSEYPRCCWQENGMCHSLLLPLGKEAVSPEECSGCPVRHHGSDRGSLAAARALLPDPRLQPCLHLGRTLERYGCGCQGRWLRSCEVHGRCTLDDPAAGVAVCIRCPDYQPDGVENEGG